MEILLSNSQVDDIQHAVGKCNRKVHLAQYYFNNQILKILLINIILFKIISPFLAISEWLKTRPPANSSYPASDDLIWKIYMCWYQNKDNIDAIVSILMERGMGSKVA